jgi:hypothetical protein
MAWRGLVIALQLQTQETSGVATVCRFQLDAQLQLQLAQVQMYSAEHMPAHL